MCAMVFEEVTKLLLGYFTEIKKGSDLSVSFLSFMQQLKNEK